MKVAYPVLFARYCVCHAMATVLDRTGWMEQFKKRLTWKLSKKSLGAPKHEIDEIARIISLINIIDNINEPSLEKAVCLNPVTCALSFNNIS